MLSISLGVITAIQFVFYQRQKRKLARLTELSLTDELTKLHNRRSLFIRAEEELQKSMRHGKDFSVAVCDLDFFKSVNDNHGHAVGDDVLRSVSSVFRSEMRGGDVVGRIGGEEFAIVMPHTSGDQATIVLERLVASVREHDCGHGIHVTVSIGVATYNKSTDGCEGFGVILKRADTALYQAKDAGRNRLCCG